MPGRGQDPSMPRLNYAVTPQIAPDMMQFTESCMMKPLMTIPLGFVLGAGFGVFMGSWEGIAPPPLLPGIPMAPSKPIAQEFKATARTMGSFLFVLVVFFLIDSFNGHVPFCFF